MRRSPMRSAPGVVLLCTAIALLAAIGAWAAQQVVHPAHPADTAHGPHVGDPVPRTGCRACHTCENPTREDPCLVDCPRHDRRFYGAHGADEGPGIVIIDQLVDLYRPVVFAHRVHARMSAMSGGCENCHHYSEQSGEIPPCRECHDESRNPTDLRRPALKGAYHRQCINCHLDWGHENACGFCHEEATDRAVMGPAAVDKTDIVGIAHPQISAPPTYIYETDCEEGPIVTFHHADHVDAFGQTCVDCHRGDGCARCHDTDEAEPPPRLDHVTSCCTCHFERDCTFCHAEAAQPAFHHAQSTEWPLSRYHEQVACTTCHGEPGVFLIPEKRCVSCHIHWESGEGFQHAVTGLELDEVHLEADCSDCHEEMVFTRPPTCEACHDDDLLPDQLPGTRTPPGTEP